MPALEESARNPISMHQTDETEKKDKAVISALKKLGGEGVLSTVEYKRLYPRGSVIPRLYGIPKTHKENIPVRPIMSMTNTAYEPLSKWLAQKLQPIEAYFSEYCIKDSFSFVDVLRGVNTHSTFPAPSSPTVMVSYDVSSLFTNVPVFETIDIIIRAVEEQPHLCGISPSLLRELLTLCTTNVQFRFNDVFWRQIDGVAMGSPLSCLFANVFMGHIEQTMHDQIKSHCSLYLRYVDDTFALVNDEQHAHEFLRVLNDAHPCLHFTYDLELSNFLPFLDVGVHKQSDGTFSTTIYRKQTFNGVYLNYHSFAPLSFKKGLVRTLFIRACRICSPEHLQCEFDFLFHALQLNSYPEYFINRHKVTSYVPNNSVSTAEKKPVYIRLPFYGDGPTARLRRALTTATKRMFFAAQPVITFSTTKLPVASPKDRLPTASMSSVIYSFRCGCRTASYIGRTSRTLAVRAREHIPKWLEMGRPGRCHSSISEHLLACTNCPPAPRDRFTIVAQGRNQRVLRILEALFIKRDQPSLCKQKDYVIDLALPW